MVNAKKIVPKADAAASAQAHSTVGNSAPIKKAVTKPMTKSPVDAAVKAPASKKVTVKTSAPKAASTKEAKPKKPKLVRDSFTIPKAEYGVLEELKQRADKLARPVKKSELIRASIKVLASLSGAAFLTALNQVPIIKTGRPAGKK